MGIASGKKSYQDLERELKEARDLIEAIRNGHVDVVRSGADPTALLKLEKLELVEERTRLIHKLQESNDDLISEIKIRNETETKLHSAVARAERATMLKDKFVSLVSHDLRTPLSSIIGFLRLALDSGESQMGKDSGLAIKAAVRAAERMDILINELLEAGRIKSGLTALKRSFVNLYLLTVQTLSHLEEMSSKKGVTLVNKVPSKMFIFADDILLGQVIYNLVHNAIKFCRSGDTVTVSFSTGERTAITVSDTGVGISPKIMDSIFDYGKKTNRVGTGGEIGSGMGLPLCKEIIEAHGGELLVESRAGEGSMFKIVLDSVRPRILIVDDENESVAQTSRIMSALDVDIITAASGEEAIRLIDDVNPHLILLDIYLPGMDGFDVLMKLKEKGRRTDIPVIILSVAGDADIRERALRYGANDFVVKANQADELLQRAGKYIGYRIHDAALRQRPDASVTAKHQVLLVEDDESLADGLKAFFEDNGMRVLVARDEPSAISLYSRCQREIGAIVVDLRLPGLGALELARRNYENSHIPLVIFTSRADAKFALEMADYGAKDYLVKPVDSGYLLNVVKNAIMRPLRLRSRVETEGLDGNVDTISVPSTLLGVRKAHDWIERKVKDVFSSVELSRFMNYAGEFLMNAHEHGNLKITREAKAGMLNDGTYDSELAEREKLTGAMIKISVSALKNEVAVRISDEGAGFRYADFLNMSESDILNTLESPSGRGIMISLRYFDSVEYGANGSSVVLIKRAG